MRRPLRRADIAALLLSLIAIGAAYWVSVRYFENIPHLEDEIAYNWQAQVFAHGRLALPTPPHPESFLVPFVVDYRGLRFGKYSPGWPAVLALGILLGGRAWVNPLLAGAGLWLTYLLGKKIWGETVGLLAALLTLTSPFFLMNSGSLLSHPLGLVLSAGFVLAWFSLDESRWSFLWAGLALGWLALTRPFTALAVGLPFGLHGLYLLARGGWGLRLRVLAVGAISLALGGLVLVWQYLLTGKPLFDLYTLWWSYDKIGFGPGVGVTPQGHNLVLAWINTSFSLRVGAGDLFGWARLSWIFLPFGWLAAILKRNGRGLLAGSVVFSLVVFYLAYWVGAWLLGPRYFYEGLFSLTLMSAAGIAWLAGWPLEPGQPWRTYSSWKRLRPLGMAALVSFLIAMNLVFYSPARLQMMHGLYGMTRAALQPFQTPEARRLTPALVIVTAEPWMAYGNLLDLETPELDSPFIFAWSRSPQEDAALAAGFPDRQVFYYYPDEPYKFYTSPH